ncbi:MAG: mechanosensitive ion channel family protein [Oscillospiraceae bacterium]|jgi:small conductance mechanosensitive channel|nr:mechanosensitive ion channel family protein [Oscillospiraceae bacterium]
MDGVETQLLVTQNWAQQFWAQAAAFAPTLLEALIIGALGFALISLLAKAIKKLIVKTAIDASLHRVITQIVKIGLQFLLAALLANILGIGGDGTWAAIIGSFGVALSLSLKDDATDIVSGLFMLGSRRFNLGDYVSISGQVGTVRKITLMYVQLSTNDNKQIFIPNATASRAIVINYSAGSKRLVEFNLTLPAKGFDESRARLGALISSCEGILEEPAPNILVESFTADSLNLIIRAWTETGNFADMEYKLKELIKKSLDSQA